MTKGQCGDFWEVVTKGGGDKGGAETLGSGGAGGDFGKW